MTFGTSKSSVFFLFFTLRTLRIISSAAAFRTERNAYRSQSNNNSISRRYPRLLSRKPSRSINITECSTYQHCDTARAPFTRTAVVDLKMPRIFETFRPRPDPVMTVRNRIDSFDLVSEADLRPFNGVCCGNLCYSFTWTIKISSDFVSFFYFLTANINLFWMEVFWF